jgi:hypothetical protein
MRGKEPMSSNTTVTTELHVSRQARSRYRFAASQFAGDGHVVFGDIHSVRVFAQEINDKRDLIGEPPKEQAVKAGQLNAMALVDALWPHVADCIVSAIRSLLGQAAVAGGSDRPGSAGLCPCANSRG